MSRKGNCRVAGQPPESASFLGYVSLGAAKDLWLLFDILELPATQSCSKKHPIPA
jgi:hypothetical protein